MSIIDAKDRFGWHGEPLLEREKKPRELTPIEQIVYWLDFGEHITQSDQKRGSRDAFLLPIPDPLVGLGLGADLRCVLENRQDISAWSKQDGLWQPYADTIRTGVVRLVNLNQQPDAHGKVPVIDISYGPLGGAWG